MFKVHNLFEMATNFALTPPVLLLFDIAHIILACLEVRSDSLGPAVTRRHPLACLASCIAMSFAGGFIANFMLGLPVIAELDNWQNLCLTIACWYLMFYSPLDIFYRLVTTFIIKLPIVAFKEMGRARKISKGIALASSVYPDSIPIMLLIGTIKGAGSGFMRTIDRMLRGVWNPQTNEILHPSFTTKITFMCTCVLMAGKYELVRLAYPQIVFVISLFLMYVKIAMMLLDWKDPLAPFERIICRVLIGSPDVTQKGGMNEDLNTNTNTAPATGISPSSTMHSAFSRPKME